jgi:thioesterase domain-containing protein
MGYVNLVRHLGPGQPAFGVRDLGDDLGRPIERIAAEHVAAVRAVRPRGPYALVSWSFGGLVAFEMALQLQRAGEPVAFVGLLDTMAPGLYRQWPQPGDDDLLVGLASEVAEGVRRPFALAPESLGGLELDEKVRRVADALHAQGAAPAALTPAALADAFHAVRARGRSSLAYEPAGPFRGTVTLFRASEGSPPSEAFFAARPAEEREGLGWAPYVSGCVDVHAVPGSHVMLAAEPHVRVLAERMAAALAAAHGRAGAAGETRVHGAPA